MRIENKSAFHQTSSIAELVAFVAGAARLPDRTRLTLSDVENPRHFTGGAAGRGCIELALSRGNFAYPYRMQHPDAAVAKEVPFIQVESWEEEILLVLAHEARHVNQIRQEQFTMDDVHEAEVDAERFAQAVLRSWRRLQGRSKAA